MSITAKKMKLIPVGDKEEVNRVYQYIRDGMYSQHQILNTYMSQMGTLYYYYNRDISNPEYKERVKEIFRNKNSAIFDIKQATGLGMAGNCGMQVKKDFRIALKNGFAKGNRHLPYYRKDFPLLVPSRLIKIYDEVKQTTDKDGQIVSKTEYYIKFPNHILFRISTYNRGKKDKQLLSILNGICDPENRDISYRDSTITLDKNKIILNLSVKKPNIQADYAPTIGRTMGVSFGYDHPCTTYISDLDLFTTIGDRYCSELIQQRLKIQNKRRELSIHLRNSNGSHGRHEKLKAQDSYCNYEKNVRNHFNHLISSDIIKHAVKNNVQTIVIGSIPDNNSPVILRNWSIYSLISQVKYKAKKYNINVEEIDSTYVNSVCSCCSAPLDVSLPNSPIWIDTITISCPKCNTEMDYYANIAKNLLNSQDDGNQ